MAASFSTSSLPRSYTYDVYLNFRGEDVRKTFVEHLYAALEHRGIRTFKEDEMLVGGERISVQLWKAIEDSKICIVVFSENYASSSWCLNELATIMECRKMTGCIVFPVFYHVNPSEVRKQSGAFGEAFAKHNNNKEEVGKWREALKEAADLAGLILNDANGHEAQFIKKIVHQVSLNLKLRSINVNIDEKIVGMDPRIERVLPLLEIGIRDVRMIGIKGIGGGGKTTLARAVFDVISSTGEFEGRSFVEDVSKVSKTLLPGLKSLQQQVLSNLSKDQRLIVSSIYDGINKMKEVLRNSKVLLLLDDVDDTDQLEALAGAPDWFGPGSRIIVTTRDGQVLKAHGVTLIHNVDLLSNEEAICLFSRYAFGRDVPSQAYEKLSLEVVRYAAGLPLTIKVLGSSLRDKDKLEWINALERLKTIPLRETLEKLESSYIGLEDDYKEIFLDVACLLKGLLIDDVIIILESCGLYARIGLRILEEKSLVTINDEQHLVMHPRIEELGKNIVRRLHPDKPNSHSRLWIHEEVEYILANGLGTKATKAIAVDSAVCSEVVTKGFGSMKNLRLLRVVSEIDDDCDVTISQSNQYFPNALQFLSWVGYPHRSLPKTFKASNLVALEMPYSRIQCLWDGEEREILYKLKYVNLRNSQLCSLDLRLTPKLERLDLEDCNHLVELHTPIGCLESLKFLNLKHSQLRALDLERTPKLEWLDLEDCDQLVELHTPDGCLEGLMYLNLSGCSRIESFKFIKGLESLEVLSLNRLYLKMFPDIIPGHTNNRLLELQFRYNDIEELPSSITNLEKLVYLDLYSCSKLRSLPGSICGLKYLRNLKLCGCILEELPEDIGRLECLEKLNLSDARIKHLPDSICMLKRLKTLNLSFCWNLEKLPGDLGQLECLQKLILTECTKVRDILDNICKLKRLKYLSLLDCVQLENLPMEFEHLECLEELNVKGTRIRHLPQSISKLTGLKIYGHRIRSSTLESSSLIKKLKD